MAGLQSACLSRLLGRGGRTHCCCRAHCLPRTARPRAPSLVVYVSGISYSPQFPDGQQLPVGQDAGTEQLPSAHEEADDPPTLALNVLNCFFMLPFAPQAGHSVGISASLRTSVSSFSPHASQRYSKIGIILGLLSSAAFGRIPLEARPVASAKRQHKPACVLLQGQATTLVGRDEFVFLLRVLL